jgi:hypothetical protein
MRGVKLLFVLVLPFVVTGCSSCGKSGTTSATDASPAASSAPLTAAAAPELSLPIGADLAPDGAIWVAGYAAARKAVVVTRFDASGAATATGDAFTEADWTSGAELRVFSGAKGIAVAFRGLVGGKSGQHVRLMDPSAHAYPGLDAFDADGIPCGTKDAVVAMDRIAAGGRLTIHPFDGSAAKLGLPSVPDATLACGDSKAFLLDDGDDGLAVRSIEQTTTTNVAPGEGDDEPRDHPAFTVGDELSILVVTTGGALKLVAPFDQPPRAVGKLGDDEDLVAVDGDEKRAFVVYTKDDLTRCGADRLVSDVYLQIIPRDGGKSTTDDVVKAGCDVDVGPFWIGAAGGKTIVAWGERDGKRTKGAPPVTGVGYRIVGEGAAQRIAVSGEDVTFAGCSGAKCFAVSLERPTGTDGMVPGKARIVAFP